MNLSYWELKSWFNSVDFTVVGSGIVGLNCALYLKRKYPKASVLILEKGILPQGASTKNAGFACFGSLSEILEDVKSHTNDEVVGLVKMRWDGLELLRKNLGDSAIGFQQYGGYELFTDKNLYEECLSKYRDINNLLKKIFDGDVFSFQKNKFAFENIVSHYAYNAFEGQLDTGKMMEALLKKVRSLDVTIINNVTVHSFTDLNSSVVIKTSLNEFKSKKLFIATNGFANELLDEDIQPARAQVLITKPIESLHIQGTFHLDRGFYYFRNIDNRILLGGGRNLDFKTEQTTEFGQTILIQNKLQTLLKNVILPGKNVEIDYSWSGIMGIGTQKKAIVKQLSQNIACGIRLGGMGVAIGSSVGKKLSLLNE